MKASRFTAAAAILFGTIAGGGALSSPAAQSQSPAPANAFSSDASQALLKTYCTGCHNERLRTGGLSLDRVDTQQIGADPALWERVAHKLRSGQMPPFGRPRPDKGSVDAFVAGLERALDEAAARGTNPGRPVTHRLTRTEYANAVRDLLALDIDARSLLPADDTDQHGFDNNSEVLSLSPSLLERYLSAARTISAHGGRPAAVGAGNRDVYDARPAVPGRPGRRAAALRLARRRGHRPSLPRRRRLHRHHPAAEDALQRGARPRRSSPARAACEPRARAHVHRRRRRSQAAAGQLRRHADLEPGVGAVREPCRRTAHGDRSGQGRNAGRRRRLRAPGVGTRGRRAAAAHRLGIRHRRDVRRQPRGRERDDRRALQADRRERHAEPPAHLHLPAATTRRAGR